MRVRLRVCVCVCCLGFGLVYLFNNKMKRKENVAVLLFVIEATMYVGHVSREYAQTQNK